MKALTCYLLSALLSFVLLVGCDSRPQTRYVRGIIVDCTKNPHYQLTVDIDGERCVFDNIDHKVWMKYPRGMYISICETYRQSDGVVIKREIARRLQP